MNTNKMIHFSLNDIANMFVDNGMLKLDIDEKIGECRLEYGNLEIDIDKIILDDPRCSGYNLRTISVSLDRIRECLKNIKSCAWEKNDENDDCLCCILS